MSHIINHRLNQLSWAVAALLLLPLLFTQGMYTNGLSFAVIARNLNEGLGTFWAPHYTDAVHSIYAEHPPFSFALHSLFYRLFGDQPWVDRFYAYTLYGLSVLMIRRLWMLFTPSGHRAWIPQLLWTVTPTVIWVHQNNLLEAPLGAATLAVVWLLVEGTMKRNYFWSALAGVLFFVGLGIKGPVALFPLIVLPLLAVIFQEHRKAALISLTVWIVSFSTLFTYFYLYQPDFTKFFERYLDVQLLPSWRGDRGTAGSVGQSLLVVSQQLIIPVLVLLGLTLRRKQSYPFRRETAFFFLVALGATLPLLWMDRQHHYNFMPAMAYWMLGFSFLYEQAPWPWGIKRGKWVKRILMTNIALWVVAIGLSIYWSKSPSQDIREIKAMRELAQANPNLKRIGVQDLSAHYDLLAIAVRYQRIELADQAEGQFDYQLVFEGETPPEGYLPAQNFEKAPFTLYKKATP